MSEAGLPGFESYTDYALYAPANTPKSIVALLSRETNTVLQVPELRAKLADLGIEIAGSTPEALHAEVGREIAKWTKIIKDANIKAGIARRGAEQGPRLSGMRPPVARRGRHDSRDICSIDQRARAAAEGLFRLHARGLDDLRPHRDFRANVTGEIGDRARVQFHALRDEPRLYVQVRQRLVASPG